MTKVVNETYQKTIKTVIEMLLNMIPLFIDHIFNIVYQYRTISDLKKDMNCNDVLVVIDFSENDLCKYAHEIQSVHFCGSHKQITLHTGVVYLKHTNSEQPEVISFCSLSKSLNHDAPAIGAHIGKILSYIKRNNIENLHFLSDSPSTQYRNKCMFFL